MKIKKIKKRTKKYKKKAGTLEILAADKLHKLNVTPSQLITMGYPDPIISTLRKVNIGKTLKKKIDEKIKRREILKNLFEDYNENYIFNPFDSQISYLTKMAYKILDSKDFKQKFWREIIKKIYLGLIEYQYEGGSHAKYYNETEIYFLLLLKKLINYDQYEDYLLDEDLYKLLT